MSQHLITVTQGALGSALRSAALILIIALLVGITRQLSASRNESELAGCIAIAMLAVGDARTFFGLGRETLFGLSDLSKLILPALAGAAAVSGTPTAAAAQCAVTALFMDMLISLSQKVLLPLIYGVLAAEIGAAAANGSALGAAAAFMKWLATALLSLIVLVFIIYLSVTGVVSGAADAAAVRVAKTTLSTALPVVGGILSDAAGSVLAGALTLKNSIGVSGMVAILSLCMAPFIYLGAQYLLYKAAGKLAGGIGGGRVTQLINGAAGAFGLMLGTVGACGLMLFFSLLAMLNVRSV